jgi:large subunit ribosomal protein L10
MKGGVINLNLNDKKKIVEELAVDFGKSNIVILTDYKGLDVLAINSLRKKLREAGVEYKVVKNTLLTRASEENDVAIVKDYFKGPIAVALGYDDPVTPAKVLTEFVKTNNKLEIKAGAMGGKFLDVDALKRLSSLPSREVLLGQVLSAMNGVSTGLVRALNDVPVKFLNVLQAIKDQKEEV